MEEFFRNVSRYPRYMLAFVLGVFNSVLQPLSERSRSNPITAVALIGAAISGTICLAQVLGTMIHPGNGSEGQVMDAIAGVRLPSA
ncbi:MAG: DUF751 family protein [Aphanocapsa feldmannii 277cV]|uniref:DUF751 family protein n=1 Tax=Aphanocapsa feldmannii 277cV TaxID=2507553 RepID=A0A524RNT5_9CHRO|nr:MAG: DUF751 family protein [Aphanocapsa feldmannii 288cV]TGG93011.1 MAG: DUF751 family protein [Aphanocapsa feldmannii 277cV]